ncbi:MAG: arsenite methyltransferase [Candidatus Parabeggiatoa sp.]|nr:arsenite methyltransferase [Candidatus Parabeggiatoa sp.]
MQTRKHDDIRQAVRETYQKVAIANNACCGNDSTENASNACNTGATCCTPELKPSAENISLNLGYSNFDVTEVPQGANMGLGCGNPQAIAALKPGETVLDLGSGGGFDCFLAAKAVGETGRVIGVDMTSEMISKARDNAIGFKNVDFRLGEIENLPIADNSIDVIISNCVINLSPEKQKVFQEAYRVLKPGGRLAISDIVATATLPDDVQNDLTLLTGCMSGASQLNDLEALLEESAFTELQIKPKDDSKQFIRDWAPGTKIEDFIVSATIEAIKPL